MVQTPSVVNWPVPEPVPVKVIWKESALADSRKCKEQGEEWNEPQSGAKHSSCLLMAVQARTFA